MKKYSAIGFVVAAILLILADTAGAIPRLQTYIEGSKYKAMRGGRDGGWVTGDRDFTMKVVGGWDTRGRLRGSAPAYEKLDAYLVVGVKRNETGSVWVNGVELTEFETTKPRILDLNRHGNHSRGGRLDVRYYRIGELDNDQKKAFNYAPWGRLTGPTWGEEIALDVSIKGFSYAKFNSTGVNQFSRSYSNPFTLDATFRDGSGGSRGVAATPEPGTLILLTTGLAGAYPLLRRRRNKP